MTVTIQIGNSDNKLTQLQWSNFIDAVDSGIAAFNGRQDDELNKNKTWPVGTNLLTADQARQMFEHVTAEEVPVFDVAPWIPPFRFEITSVFDSKGHRVCDLRGWGFLTGGGACNLPEDEASKIQDKMGEQIAALLNGAAGL